MKITLSVIKANVGSIGGHIASSDAVAAAFAHPFWDNVRGRVAGN